MLAQLQFLSEFKCKNVNNHENRKKNIELKNKHRCRFAVRGFSKRSAVMMCLSAVRCYAEGGSCIHRRHLSMSASNVVLKLKLANGNDFETKRHIGECSRS